MKFVLSSEIKCPKFEFFTNYWVGYAHCTVHTRRLPGAYAAAYASSLIYSTFVLICKVFPTILTLHSYTKMKKKLLPPEAFSQVKFTKMRLRPDGAGPRWWRLRKASNDTL